MKKVIFALAACMALSSLTACGSETQSEVSSGLAVNVSNGIAATSTQYVDVPRPSVSGVLSEAVSSDAAESAESTAAVLEDLPFAPANGAVMDDSTALGEFIINGVAFNITEDLTATEMCKRMGSDFGNWGLGNDNYNNKLFADKAGYYFFGAGLSYPFVGESVHVEAVDENGKRITKWRNMPEEGEPDFDDYNVKGVRFSAQSTPDFVHFIGGLEVGKPPEYYEELLGKGYEVGNTNDKYGFNNYRISIYKTSSVTMVIEYREKREEWRCESITLIKN